MLDILTRLPRNYKSAAEATFFSLQQNGYCSDKKPQHYTSPTGESWNYYCYGDLNRWHASDQWSNIAAENHESHGITTVSLGVIPIWKMYYRGWYHPEVLAHLKEALRENYSQNFWHGGRGPQQYQKGTLLYSNFSPNSANPKRQGDKFGRFDGEESIIDVSNTSKRLGRHQYHGGFMFTAIDDNTAT